MKPPPQFQHSLDIIPYHPIIDFALIVEVVNPAVVSPRFLHHTMNEVIHDVGSWHISL